jgi:hypothetical protein
MYSMTHKVPALADGGDCEEQFVKLRYKKYVNEKLQLSTLPTLAADA